ncbi:MAG: dephospho-CoA kinase [Actinomycetota bacterium]
MALTGPIGSGKSTFGRMLEKMGARYIDSDLLSRQVVEPGRPAYYLIIERFGQGVVGEDGYIDRERLGDIVFSDPEARDSLDRIVHPDVFVEITLEAGRAIEGGEIVIAEIPLLYDTPVDYANVLPLDAVVGLTAGRDTRVQRLTALGMPADKVLARMDSQKVVEERVDRAEFLIENNGPIDELNEAAENLWLKLQERLGGAG